MSDLKLNEMIEVLPQYSRNIPASDDKFLFFFPPPPPNIEEKFLFGLTLKTGVQIFAVVSLIQAISSFLDIFSPDSFWLFIVAIIAFCVYCVISLYAFLATLKNNYSYARVSYLISAFFFILAAIKYLCKCIIKTIEFITPWDGDFLRLEFLVYIFGRGLYLFLYLYLIYILYLYMKQLNNNPSQVINSIPKNEDDVILSNEVKEE